METFLVPLLQCSVSMSIVTLVYMTIMPFLCKRYTAKWRYRIWLVIAICWIFPYRPQLNIPSISDQILTDSIITTPFIVSNTNIHNPISVITTANETTQIKLPIWWIFTLVWFTGFMILLVHFFINHWRFIKMMNRWSQPITDINITKILNDLKCELEIKAQVSLKICPSIKSPVFIGFFHPVILLPSVNISHNELYLIMKHELIHFKRHDIWYKAMILISTAIHWFNPVVYFMAKAIATQCEISCDEIVLQGADFHLRQQYGKTIIGVIRKRTKSQTALSNNFYGGEKNMKNRIASILDSKPKNAGVTILCLVLISILTTGAVLATNNKKDNNVKNKIQTSTITLDKKYNKLLALQLENYENMTVTEYRNKVWDIIGQEEPTYFELLNNIPESWNDMRQTNKDVYFILDILTPIIAEKWETWHFGGSKVWRTGKVEYGASYTILNPDSLKVGERTQAVQGLLSDVNYFVDNKNTSELANERAMQTLLESESQKWLKKYNNPSINVTFTFLSFRSGVINEHVVDNTNVQLNHLENIPSNAKLEDFQLLLSLKTEEYEKLSVSDFNKSVIVTMKDNGDFPQEVFKRVYNSLNLGNYPETLTQEDLHFLTITLRASTSENSAKHMQNYSNKIIRPCIPNTIKRELTTQVNDKEVTTFRALIEYTLCYDILEDNQLTILKRDRSLLGLIDEVRTYFNNMSEDELVNGKAALEVEIEKLEKQYSNKQIKLDVDNIVYQIYDERDIEALQQNKK